MDMPFVDVDDTDWFAEAVYYCYQNSLLRGRSEMSFDPDAAMTRAELVTVLWRIAGSPNSDNVGKTPFTDVPAVHRSRELVLGEQDRQRHRRRPVRPGRPDHA